MDSEYLLFEKGCFLPSWVEDEEDIKISSAYQHQVKDMATLQNELEGIKKHLEDVRERKWQIEKLLHFHQNDFVKE